MEYVKSNTDSSLENEIRHDNQQTALANANIDEEYCVQAETSSFITRETLIVIEDDVKSSGQVINQNVYRKRMLSSSEVVDTIWKGCNVGYIEGKIDGVCISDNRLLELRGQGFISDKIIDAYLLLLSRKYSNPNTLKPKEGQIMFLNPMGEQESQTSKLTKNWKVFWRMRIKALGADDIRGIILQLFIRTTREDLEKYRKEIAEQLIECSDDKETGWCSICGLYRSEDSEIVREGESLNARHAPAALIYATNEAQLPPIGSAPSATTAPKAASTPSKKARITPSDAACNDNDKGHKQDPCKKM
eukprot:gene2309-2659_t